MTLRADSYGTIAEVIPLVRSLVGAATFNSTTEPTLTQVEKMIDRASGVLNIKINEHGYTTPISNSTAKLTCDEWVVNAVSGMIYEIKIGSVSSGDQVPQRPGMLAVSADQFVSEMSDGWMRLGLTKAYEKSNGLSFTAEDRPEDRSDPADTSLAQPKFRKGLFDNRTINYTDDLEDDE